MSRKKLVETLSDAHVLALDAWITKVGSRWRQPLADAWMARAAYPEGTTNPDALRSLYNKYGMTVILKLRTADIQDEAAKARVAQQLAK